MLISFTSVTIYIVMTMAETCVWCAGPNKIKFIPELVGPFLEMTLIPEIGQSACVQHGNNNLCSVRSLPLTCLMTDYQPHKADGNHELLLLWIAFLWHCSLLSSRLHQCTHVACDCEWVTVPFMAVVYWQCSLAGAMSNCCHLGTGVVYTIQPCTSLQCHVF